MLDILEVYKARETIGDFIAMEGTQEVQMEAMLEITRKWADRVRSGRLTHAEAWFLIILCIMKTLEYPLMVDKPFAGPM